MDNQSIETLLQNLRLSLNIYRASNPSGNKIVEDRIIRNFFFSNTAKQIVDAWFKANLPK